MILLRPGQVHAYMHACGITHYTVRKGQTTTAVYISIYVCVRVCVGGRILLSLALLLVPRSHCDNPSQIATMGSVGVWGLYRFPRVRPYSMPWFPDYREKRERGGDQRQNEQQSSPTFLPPGLVGV
jgi:hypothetical protein